MKRKAVSHITAGIITTAVAIALFFIYYYSGMSFVTNFLSMLPYIVTVLLLIVFVLLYGIANNNNVTYNNLFSYGFRTTMIFSLLMVGFILVVLYVLPGYKEKYLHVMKSRMDIDTTMTQVKKELAFNTTSNHFRTIQVGFNLFMNLIAGTVGTVIAAATASKKERPSSAHKE